MFRARYIISFLVLLVLLVSCTSAKNTKTTRWYHSFNTRYNVYFNGKEAFDEAWKNQLESYEENYTEMILMYPVSALPKDKQTTGGAFDRAIEKAVKAIKQHSIQTKPARKTGQRNDPKYKEFMSRIEYNPFLYNAWLLMAKSQFFNGDFLQAASSFSYISRLYESQPEIAAEAKIWHARCYSEMEWYYEAEDILVKSDSAILNKRKDLNNLWNSVQADLLVKQKNYEDAIPFLKKSIKGTKNKYQREREKYLLGQVYTKTGQKDLAYQTFGGISSSRAPYVLEFSAKIRQTEVYQGSDVTKSVKQLKKMAKSSKNKEYLDQVYYAMGNVYMSVPDTTLAIESYEKGVEESTRNGIDKALNQIQLGDIYFQQRDYVKAQPNYSEALGFLKKKDDAYPRVSKRSEVLDELLIYHEAVILQDSLLRLSEMTEEEQLVIVDKIIEDLIKAEEEERKKAERDEMIAEREANRAPDRMPPTGVIENPLEAGSFYFYSTQSVARGKSDFQQKWGRRKLEDDWRRKDKATSYADDEESIEGEEPELEEGLLPEADLAEEADQMDDANPEDIVELSTDPHEREFYLQQIPQTEEDKEAANLIIADGLFNMGVIYKDKLEDTNLALETFETLDIRYPENEHKLEAYYHTYMIYFRLGDMAMANVYKQKIRAEFPESDYAIAMADPDYEYNLKMMYVLQDSIYQATYDAYLDGNIRAIRENYNTITEKYPQTKLMPKFIFLNALSYVQEGDANQFKEGLKLLIEKYPEADVSVLASEMMKGFQRGLILSGDGMLAKGGLFNFRFGGMDDVLQDPSELAFLEEVRTPYQLSLIYPTGLLNDNMLLYTVASYNFGNFQVNDFDLEKVNMGDISMLQIKTFDNLNQVLQYVQMIEAPDGYTQSLGPDVIILPISIENYDILMKGKNLSEYMDFFKEHYAKQAPKLVERWKLTEESVEEEVNQEEPETEVAEEIQLEETEVMEDDQPEETVVLEDIIVEEADDDEVVIDMVAEEETVTPVEEDIWEEADDLVEDAPEEDPWADAEEMEDKSNNIFKKLGGLIEEKLGVDFDELLEEEATPEEEKKSKLNPIEEYVKQQEAADKEREKQEAEDRKLQEKLDKELKKQQAKDEKEAKKLAEKQSKAEEKAKADERKRVAKEKEDARKAKEKQRKEEQKLKEQQRKQREKERKEEQKLKEQQRKAALKQKEQERKEKEKAREAERKQKEQERKNKK